MSYQDFVSAIASKKLSLSALAVLDVMCNRYKTDIITNTAVDVKSIDVMETAPRYAIGDGAFIGGHKKKTRVNLPSFCQPTKGLTTLAQLGFIVRGPQERIEGQPNFWHWADVVHTLSANAKRYISENPDIFAPLQEALAKEAASQFYVAALFSPSWNYDISKTFGSCHLLRVLRETPKGFYVETQDVVSDDGKKLHPFGYCQVKGARQGQSMISKEHLYKKEDGSFAITLEEFKALYAITNDYADAYAARIKRRDEALLAITKKYEEEERQALKAARQSLIDQDLL